MIIKRRQSYHRSSIASILIVGLISTSCSANQEPSDNDKKPKLEVSKQRPTAEPLTAAGQLAASNGMKKMTQEQQTLFSRQDLATRLALKIDEVRVSGTVNVTWRSGALGCPKSGMQYTQALVPGVSMMLVADKKAYRYHAKAAGEPFYCPDDLAEAPNVTDSEI